MNINYDSNSHVYMCTCFMDAYYVYSFILEREVSRNKVHQVQNLKFEGFKIFFRQQFYSLQSNILTFFPIF